MVNFTYMLISRVFMSFTGDFASQIDQGGQQVSLLETSQIFSTKCGFVLSVNCGFLL